MKTFLKHLLVLALMVLVFSGCQNPSGHETPEDTAKLTKVEFRWGTLHDIGDCVGRFETYTPMYLLDLHFDSDLNSYVYDFPEGYDLDSYRELIKDEERFKKFSEDAFEKVFGTKYYKEGTIIDLKKWTSRAICLINTDYADCLNFSIKDIYDAESYKAREFFEEFVVGNEDILVYVFFDSQEFNDLNELRYLFKAKKLL